MRYLSPETRLSYVASMYLQNHKECVKRDDWLKVHPNLLKLGMFTVEWCEKKELPLVFTSIIRPKIPGVSKTDIHAHGRAFDISTKGWTSNQIGNFICEINKTHSIGAISMRDGKEREAVYEDGVTAGKGPHLHVQCRA